MRAKNRQKSLMTRRQFLVAMSWPITVSVSYLRAFCSHPIWKEFARNLDGIELKPNTVSGSVFLAGGACMFFGWLFGIGWGFFTGAIGVERSPDAFYLHVKVRGGGTELTEVGPVLYWITLVHRIIFFTAPILFFLGYAIVFLRSLTSLGKNK